MMLGKHPRDCVRRVSEALTPSWAWNLGSKRPKKAVGILHRRKFDAVAPITQYSDGVLHAQLLGTESLNLYPAGEM